MTHGLLANSQKIAIYKWLFYDHFWPFFSNSMFIFHKNEVQTVILRCLTSLSLKWYKIYDTKPQRTQMRFFFTKLQKNQKWKYLHFVS